MLEIVGSDLVARARLGDSDAFGQLVARHAESVRGYCYYSTGDFEEARDLCQETFVLAYTKLHQLREDSKFPAWIRRIAQNVCRRWVQKRRETPVEEITIPYQPTESPAAAIVKEALDALPDKERLAVVLHYVDGLSHCEIAEFLEVSEGAIRGRIHRGRKMLRMEMTEMTRKEFDQHKLESDFVVRTVDLARSFTRRGLGWSPDGKHIMFLRCIDDPWGVQLWISSTEGTDAQPVSPIGWEECWAWSPDSRKIVYAYTRERSSEQEGSLNVFDIESGQSRPITSGFDWEAVDGLARCENGWSQSLWSPDSKQVALMVGRDPRQSPYTDVVLYDADTGESIWLTPEALNTGRSYPGDWSPDGAHFALVSYADDRLKGRIWVFDRSGKCIRSITDETLDVVSDPRYRPTSGEIAFSAVSMQIGDSGKTPIADIRITDWEGNNPRRLTDGSKSASTERTSFTDPEWTSDGAYIVCLTRKVDEGGHECQGISIIDADTSEVVNVLESDPHSDQHLIGFRNKMSICANGKRIAFTVGQYTVDDRRARVPGYTDRRDILYYYDIPTRSLHEVWRSSPEEDGILLFNPGFHWMPLWSPDGARILCTKGVSTDQSSWLRVPKEGRIVDALGSVWDVLEPPAEPTMCFVEIG